MEFHITWHPSYQYNYYNRKGKVIQELLGHSSLETTMIYTHVSQKKLAVVESPLDRL